MQRSNLVSCYTDEFVSVCGRISEIPYKRSDIWCYTLNCESLEYMGREESFDERISFYSKNPYSLDDSVKVEGILSLHDKPKNPGGFDAYAYYKSIGINYKITAYKDYICDKKYVSHSIYSYTMRLRDKMCGIIDNKFRPDDASVLKSILTGFKKNMEPDYTEKLQNTGVLRCLYSPYFHLLLIIPLIGLVFKKAYVKTRGWIIFVCCILYMVQNPYSVTARKLFGFVAAVTFFENLCILYNRLDILCGTILICGICNPFILYNRGFIMSCCATLFIMIFYVDVYWKVRRINRRNMFAKAVSFAVVSLILLTPVAAFLFDGIPLYSPIVSAVLFPIIATIYILSPLIFVGGIFSDISVSVIGGFIAFIRNVPAVIEHLPFYNLSYFKPSFVLLSSYILILWAWCKRENKAASRAIMALSLGLFVSFLSAELGRVGKAEVQFLQVGQGDCSFFDVPYKSTVMVDTGGNANFIDTNDIGKQDIVPYIRYKGIYEIDCLFISHYHKDHCEGLLSLLDAAKIKTIFLPDYVPKNQYRTMIEQKAKSLGTDIRYIKGPKTIRLDGGILCEILHFDKNAEDDNDKSVVMRLSYGGVSCLYVGDATYETEKILLDEGIDLKADILKVGHHASKTSSSEEFLKSVNPDIAVAMCAEDNPYGFPADEVVLNMEKAGIEFLTAAEGCIEIKERNGKYTWQRKTH